MSTRWIRATRFHAENKGKSMSVDLVVLETNEDTFEISYEAFKEVFELYIPKNDEIEFIVRAEKCSTRKVPKAR